MKLFSNCSGSCGTCSCAGGCLAGHGDDDYSPASKDQVIERLDKNLYQNDRREMIGYLKGKFDYDYEKQEIPKYIKVTDLIVSAEEVNTGKRIVGYVCACKHCQTAFDGEVYDTNRPIGLLTSPDCSFGNVRVYTDTLESVNLT